MGVQQDFFHDVSGGFEHEGGPRGRGLSLETACTLRGGVTIFWEKDPGLHVGEVWYAITQRPFSGNTNINDGECIMMCEKLQPYVW